MVLVLFICVILIILMLLIIAILLSTINFKVNNFRITNLISEEKTKFELIFNLKLFNKFKIFSIKLNEKKLYEITRKMHLEKITIKELESKFVISDIKELIRIKMKLTELNLNLELGLEDIMITTYVIPTICAILSILLPFITNRENIKDIKYKVEPIYNQKISYDINLSSNIEIKIINILNAAYGMYKDRKDKSDSSNKNRMDKFKLMKNNIRCNV